MDNLPKELTPNLLSMVLDIPKHNLGEIIGFKNDDLIYEQSNVLESMFRYSNSEINLDTLTRLMKEWCTKDTFCFNESEDNDTIYIEVISRKLVDFKPNASGFKIEKPKKKRFEAVLKATYWVAKEKGLINGK